MYYKDSVVPPSHLHHLEKSKHWHNQLFEVYQVRHFIKHAKFIEHASTPSMMMMMMIMNCFCGMVDQRKVISLISSRDHCQRSSPSRISDTSRARFEPAQNLSSGLVEWSCAVVIKHVKYVKHAKHTSM